MKEPFYQVTTMYPLLKTKVMCETQQEIFDHLDIVISKTERSRSKMDYQDLKHKKLTLKVTIEELEKYVVVLKIDPRLEPKVLNFLGCTM